VTASKWETAKALALGMAAATALALAPDGGTGGRAFKSGIQDMAVQTSLWAETMKPLMLTSLTLLHAGDHVESSDSRHVSKFN